VIKSQKTIRISLNKNLVRSIKRGEPWLYESSIDLPQTRNVSLCELFYKKQFVAWGFFDPHSPIKVRIISTQKNWKQSFFENDFLKCIEDKYQAICDKDTNCFRAINGEGDFFPGLICDVYNKVAVLQADGEGPYQFYDFEKIAQLLMDKFPWEAVYFKARNQHDVEGRFLKGDAPCPIEVKENACRFLVNYKDGQKTGFFLDQRNNRNYVKKIVKNKSLLNLFSYTGGFSVAAGVGGANKVVSVDIAQPATDYAHKNWLLNNLSTETHQALAVNVFDYLDEAKKEKQIFDIVVCDPPSFSNNEKGKDKAIASYIDVFCKAAELVKADGSLILSSCSSHISYEDFFEIAEEVVSKSRKKAKLVYMGSQAEGHCFPLAFRKFQYLKFIHLKFVI
jgi:23S rRNA (cytosine1962-C5)-methyltransferase